MTPTLITLHEAADRLGVHYMTAYRYVRTGRLAAVKVGAEWRVDVADLRPFLEPGAVEPPRRRRTDYATRVVGPLVAGDEAGAWTVVEQALGSGLEPAGIYVEVLAPALHRIGALWEAGEVSVGEEHQASTVVLRLIGRLGPRLRRRGRTRGSIVLGAPPGEQHGLPIALLGDLLRARGFRVHDLGADVPPDSLAQAAQGAERLIAVGIGATTSGNERNIRRAIQAVRAVVDTPVVLGGGGVADLVAAQRLGADLYADRAPAAIEVFEQAADGRGRDAPS
jgi:excisionase family DNA binding protein